MSVRFGIDQFLAGRVDRTAGRIGLVTNAAATLASSRDLPTRLALQRAGLHLVRLFSPEHGLHAGTADGKLVTDSVDALTGLPIISLYGERLRPGAQHLADLDLVVFDIPDIGTRFYTYIWTLFHVLEACAEARRSLLVLDRPNPLGGEVSDAEGPLLELAHCASFLGRAAIPVRHSLTAGELALLWNKEGNLGAELRIMKCTDWNRAMHWPDTGLPFVPTSPAMPTYESALLYPGMCLFEATNVSIGRGTAMPFQVIAAAWLRPGEVADRFNSFGLPGAKAEVCKTELAGAAVRLRVVEPRRVRPVALGLHLLAVVIELHSNHFAWARYPTVANPSGENHFERLIGRQGIREELEKKPANITRRIAEWTAVADWPERVEPILLYE